MVAAICVIVLALSSLCAQASFGPVMFDAVICNCKQYATLRSWPSPNAPALERVYLGEEVTILSRIAHKDSNMDFVMVETDRNIGYVWLNCIRVIAGEGDGSYSRYGYVSSRDSNLHSNLRSGPGTNYSAIGYLFGGESVPYLGRKEKDKNGRVWYCCEVDGTVCWISSKVVQVY